MKKAASILVTVAMTLTLFSGCGTKAPTSSASAKLSGKIVFETHRTDMADTTLKAIAKEFTDANPGTTIEIEGVKDPDSTIKTRMAADEMPDICQVLTTVKQSDFSKYFAPIDSLGFNKDNFYYVVNGQGPDGKLYALTDGVTYGGGITYNVAVFKAAGIDKVPTTMDEFMAACAKIKAKGVVPFASNFKDKWPLSGYDPGFGTLINGDVAYKNKLADSDKFLEGDGLKGMEFLKTMKDKGYLEPDLMSTNWDGFKKDMAQGKVAMTFLGSWVNPQIIQNGANAADIGWFTFPGATIYTLGADTMYGVAAHSKNLPLAKAFFKYLYSEGRISIATDMVPGNKNLTTLPAIAKTVKDSGVKIVEGIAQADAYTNLINKAQIDTAAIVQEYLTAKDPTTVVKKYNDLWATARKG
ncbi:MAG TPA: extracellular solute-binding protein [Clostridiaceae bacterium]